jgi:hypothetical protein
LVDPSIERTVYTYGPGTLTIDALFSTPSGIDRQGSFVSAVDGFQLFVCEGCDALFDGSLADDLVIELGTGSFDAVFARALGVSRSTIGGSLPLGLEAIEGGPDSSERGGFSHTGYADLSVIQESVPEPGLLALGLVLGGMMLGRARRSRRRTN